MIAVGEAIVALERLKLRAFHSLRENCLTNQHRERQRYPRLDPVSIAQARQLPLQPRSSRAAIFISLSCFNRSSATIASPTLSRGLQGFSQALCFNRSSATIASPTPQLQRRLPQ